MILIRLHLTLSLHLETAAKHFWNSPLAPLDILVLASGYYKENLKKRISATFCSFKASSISKNYKDTQRMGRSTSQWDI
ncbi:Bgt-51776 [Blumeria graminis f. sp. tritici]|uniref:Bgt-51776 n=1 Tax=Blumeria graminis f. sp. tritici TaxID=62690 RepID=A0A9X9PQS6_BLUGR|nr:Bgt-51776 [Blumeria graminis f. sp. tritici]